MFTIKISLITSHWLTYATGEKISDFKREFENIFVRTGLSSIRYVFIPIIFMKELLFFDFKSNALCTQYIPELLSTHIHYLRKIDFEIKTHRKLQTSHSYLIPDFDLYLRIWFFALYSNLQSQSYFFRVSTSFVFSL